MEAELLAAIYATPDDDAPRLVYADWLQGRGDPRGQFIALQLADTGHALQDELLRAHRDTWLGACARAIGTPQFVRGFVARFTPNGAIDGGDPALALVHTLALQASQVGVYEALLGRLPRLRRVEITTIYARVEMIALVPPRGELRVPCDSADLANWVARAGDLARLELVEPGESGWTATWTRDTAGALSVLELAAPDEVPQAEWLRARFRPYGESLVAGLGQLPPTQLTQVAIRGPVETLALVRPRLARALAGQQRVAITWG